MKEQLYTIPVNDAFKQNCECPLCFLNQELERNAIEYTMGPSYMEDDNRAETDRLGFCADHIRKLYNEKNRLGLALMLKTHTDKTIKDLKELSASSSLQSKSLFKKAPASSVSAYIKELESHCFICERMTQTRQRYLDTFFHLWKKDTAFKDTVKTSKGFCVQHYGILMDQAGNTLSKEALSEFEAVINEVFFTNMERVNEDLEWFINKFDYRYANEPWKQAKDSIPRAIIKTNSTIVETQS